MARGRELDTLEEIIISVIQRTLVAGTPLLLATIGEIICERSGILNLGIEGMMAIGAVTAFIVTFTTGSPWLGLLAAVIATAALSVIHAFVSISLQSSQVVSGLALTMLGLGISGLVGKPYIGKPLAEKMATWPIPVLADIPVVGVIFFDHSPFFYMAIVLALVAWFVLQYTRLGITIRSAGENPRATETQGMTAGRGWIVIALTIFALWNPMRAIIGAFLFGGIFVLQYLLQPLGISPNILAMLPYICTLLVLFVGALIDSRKLSAPAMLAEPYRRGER